MNALIVVSNPDPSSFSAAIVGKVRDGLAAAGHDVEIADLAREGFDPRMNIEDLSCYRGLAPPPAEILREQERVDRADALVFVFPIYWWSLPALLKGWVDRVFTHGWAYGFDESGALTTRLRDRPVRLLAIGAGDFPGYEKHGYRAAMLAQIEHGIFGFCGLTNVTTAFMLEVEGSDPAVRGTYLDSAFRIGEAIDA